MSMDSNLVTFAGDELIQLKQTLDIITEGIASGSVYSLRVAIDDTFREGLKFSVNQSSWGPGRGTMIAPMPEL